MLRIVIKDLRIFFSDKKAVALTFIMPMGLITLFVFAFGGTQKDAEIPEMKLLVSDMDQTEKSMKLLARMDLLPAIKTEQKKWSEARSEVDKGKRIAALCILPAFSDSLNTEKPGFVFYYDASERAQVAMLKGALSDFLFRETGRESMAENITRKMMLQSGGDTTGSAAMKAFIFSMMQQAGNGNPVEILMQEEKAPVAQEVSPALVQAVAGTAVMTLLFAVAGMGAGLLDEKEKGTLRRLLLSPIHPFFILFGKLCAAVGIGVIQLLLLMIFSYFFFGLNIGINIVALFICIFFTALSAASFGMFIASISSSRRQVEGMSTIIVLVMSAIGGSMMPTFFMPEFMQKMAVVSVNYWSIQGFYDIFWREFSWMDFSLKMMVLALVSLVMMGMSMLFYRRNILRIS